MIVWKYDIMKYIGILFIYQFILDTRRLNLKFFWQPDMKVIVTYNIMSTN